MKPCDREPVSSPKRVSIVADGEAYYDLCGFALWQHPETGATWHIVGPDGKNHGIANIGFGSIADRALTEAESVVMESAKGPIHDDDMGGRA